MKFDSAIPDLTGAILAGGQARRMGGINKAQLPVGGVPIIERINATLSRCCEQVIVIANHPESYRERGLTVFPDLIPGAGTLGGLYTALEHASTEYVFVCACDMPFINEKLIRHLVKQLEGHDAAIPRDEYGLQPMHAVYKRSCRSILQKRLESGLLKVEDVLYEVCAVLIEGETLRTLDPRGCAFMNVNRPADLEHAQELANNAEVPNSKRIRVYVSLHATMKRYAPDGRAEQPIVVSVPEGTKVESVLRKLKIPRDQLNVTLIRGRHVIRSHRLLDGDHLDVFPPMAGG